MNKEETHKIVSRVIIKYFVMILIVSTVIASCNIIQPYRSPQANLDNLYRNATDVDTVSIASRPWKLLLTDSILQRLIAEGLAKNFDLKIALLRITQASAMLRKSKAAFLPKLDISTQARLSKQSRAALNFPENIDINLNTTLYKLELNTSWEIDIWGKLGSAKRSALASMLRTEAAHRAIKTQVVAQIAKTYYRLLALDEQLNINEQTLEYRIADVETMKALKKSAIVTGAAVVQSEANRYATDIFILNLKQRIMETENALSMLLARDPGSIERSTIAEQQSSTELSIGVPALLLRNRPDVQEAELVFRSAFENTNLARSYFYPALTITAAGGLSSLTISSFFLNSIFANIIGGLTQPIFNQGTNKLRLRLARARQKEALYQFQKLLLTAGQEVSNAMASYQNALSKQESRQKQLASLEKAVEYTKELLRYSSTTNYVDVLTSEQSLLSAQLNATSDRLQELEATVDLYRALGGGTK